MAVFDVSECYKVSFVKASNLVVGQWTQVGLFDIMQDSVGTRAFSVAGPTVWISLPYCLHDQSLSEDTFIRSLKTYLFSLYQSM